MSNNKSKVQPKQTTLFSDDEISGGRKPASDLMKAVATKIPSKKKIKNDFSPAEQAEIFGRIEADKARKAKHETSSDNDFVNSDEEELKKLKRQQRREKIRKVKGVVKEMEIGNRDKVILFPSYSRDTDEITWYKMANFSALYYAFRMADRLERRRPILQKDKDRFYKMNTIVSIPNVDSLINDAMQLKEFDRYEETIDKIYILYLKNSLSDDEYALLARTGKMQKDAMHQVLRPKKAAPELYLGILTLGRQTMAMTQKLNIVFRQELGDAVVQKIGELLGVYFEYTEGLIDTKSVKRQMTQTILRIKAAVALLGEAEVMKPARACAIGETIVKIEGMIEEL